MFKLTTTSLFALAASAVSVQAQEIPTGPANASDIALVEAQYNASGFDAALPNSQSFNISLNATALLTVVYGSNLTIENGSPYTAAQVATKPIIYVTPESETGFNETDQFTLVLADASAVGQPDPEGDYRHYLANSISGGSTAENLTFALGNGTSITSYAGPGPLANSGVHRYAWLLFSQPADFAAPANLSSGGVSPGHWSVESYVNESKLGSLVAASFFNVVHEGDSTASAVPTSSVDPATLSVAASTTALASGASSAASAGASGVAGAAAGSTGAAASSFVVAKTLALVAAAAGAFVVLA